MLKAEQDVKCVLLSTDESKERENTVSSGPVKFYRSGKVLPGKSSPIDEVGQRF